MVLVSSCWFLVVLGGSCCLCLFFVFLVVLADSW